MEPSFNQSLPSQRISWTVGCLLIVILAIGLTINGFLRLVEIGVSLSGAGGGGRLIVIWISLAISAVIFAIWVGLTRGAVRDVALRWLAALPLPALLAGTSLIPSVESQFQVLVQLGVCLCYALGITWLTRHQPFHWHWSPLVLSIGLLTSLPWLVIGAPDSWFDLGLALLLGGVVGWIVGRLLMWRPPLSWQQPTTVGVWLAEGAAIGLLLLIVSRALGPNHAALIFLFSTPAAGWLLLSLAKDATIPAITSVGTLFGVWYIGVPLAFTDSDTLHPLFLFGSFPEGLHLAILAAIGQTILAILAILLIRYLPNRRIHTIGAGVLAVVGVMLLIVGGRAAPNGDRLFVVLRDQAVLNGLETIADYNKRRTAVYQRLVSHATITQAPLRSTLDRLGIRYTPYYLVNGLEVEADLPVRLWLQSRPEVAEVIPVPHLRPLPISPQTAVGNEPPPTETPWNLVAIGAPEVWARGIQGAGIIIGQADSGVDYTHPELIDAYAGRTASGIEHTYHWLDPWTNAPAPYDVSGHGTHTLATVLGNQVGVAPDATWIGCVNLARNLGNAPRYLDCLQFLFAPYPSGGDPFRDGNPTRGAHILNNSWGCPSDLEGCTVMSLQPAVRALRIAGVFVVASAGNDGPACGSLNAPLAIYDEVMTVGAVDAEGRLAFFSSVGPVQVDGSLRPKPDLVAPGVDILAAFPNQSYYRAEGTSMAGPHVAGAVALMWSANPALIGDIDTTTRILKETARPYPHSDGDRCGAGNGVGAGLLDVAAAVRRALGAR